MTFAGIHPLDSDRGGIAVARLGRAGGAGRRHARRSALAPVATDLTNPDLLDFMLALARTADVSRSDVHDARALMMQRLRADWERAADADGNPYRRDYETEGSETVLRRLVRASARADEPTRARRCSTGWTATPRRWPKTFRGRIRCPEVDDQARDA